MSSLAADAARDVAMENLSKDRLEANGFGGFLKKLWKHNLFAEYYQQKEIIKAKESIISSGNVFVDETDDKQYHAAAMSAIIERFSSDYHDALHLETGETKENFGASPEEDRIKRQLVDLLKEYAEKDLSDKNIADTFEAEKSRIFSQVQDKKANILSGGHMYADNLFEIAKQIQQAIIEGQSMEDLTADLEFTIGRAKAGVRTEAQYNTLERIFNKISETKPGKYLVSNGVLASGLALAYCLSSKLSQSFVRSKAAQWSTFGATTLLAGGLSGLKEAKKLEEERGQYFRQMAKSKSFREQNQNNASEYEAYRYQAVDAGALAVAIGGAMYEPGQPDEKLKMKDLDAGGLEAALSGLAELEARVTMSDRQKIDLISFSDAKLIEQERWQLDILRAKAKIDLKKYFAQADKKNILRQVCGDRDLTEFLNSLTEAKIFGLLKGTAGDENGIEFKNRLFNKMKNKKVAQAVIKGVLTALTVGTAVQEGIALATDQTGFIERMINEHKGDSGKYATALESLRRWINPEPDQIITTERIITEIVEHVPSEELTQAAAESALPQAEPPDFKDIHRDLWYDNETIKADFNELKLRGAGINQAMVDQHGNFIFSVKEMATDGSFAGGGSADVPKALTEGKIKLLLSLSKDTQNQVLEVPIGPDGLAVITKDSQAARILFDEQGNFLGQYAEVVEEGLVDENNVQHVNVIATMVGKGVEPIEILPATAEQVVPAPEPITETKERLVTEQTIIPGQKYQHGFPPPAIGFWQRLKTSVNSKVKNNLEDQIKPATTMEKTPNQPVQNPEKQENIKVVEEKTIEEKPKEEQRDNPVSAPAVVAAPVIVAGAIALKSAEQKQETSVEKKNIAPTETPVVNAMQETGSTNKEQSKAEPAKQPEPAKKEQSDLAPMPAQQQPALPASPEPTPAPADKKAKAARVKREPAGLKTEPQKTEPPLPVESKTLEPENIVVESEPAAPQPLQQAPASAPLPSQQTTPVKVSTAEIKTMPAKEQITQEGKIKTDEVIKEALEGEASKTMWDKANKDKRQIVKNILGKLFSDPESAQMANRLNLSFEKEPGGLMYYFEHNLLTVDLTEISEVTLEGFKKNIKRGLFLYLNNLSDSTLSSDDVQEFRHFTFKSFGNYTVDQLYNAIYKVKAVFGFFIKINNKTSNQNKELEHIVEAATGFAGKYQLSFFWGEENKLDAEHFKVTLDINNDINQLTEFLLSLADVYQTELKKLDELAQQNRYQERDYKEVVRESQVEMAGDVDGRLQRLFNELKDSDLVKVEDENLIWQGGKGRLLFAGDICGDRDMDGFEILSKLAYLKQQAKKEGGTVDWLAGNHEQFLFNYFFFGRTANTDPEVTNSPYVGILEPGLFSADKNFKRDLAEFKKQWFDDESAAVNFAIGKKIIGRFSASRQEILANMRANSEGRQVLKNLCQYKLLVKKDDTLFLHTPITHKIAIILAKANDLDVKIDEINGVFRTGLWRFLIEGKEFSRDDNQEFFFYYDTFLETENRHNFTDQVLETRLRQLGVNAIAHGHNYELKSSTTRQLPIISADNNKGQLGIKIKTDGNIEDYEHKGDKRIVRPIKK